MMIVLVVQVKNIKTAVAEDSNSRKLLSLNLKRDEQLILAHPFLTRCILTKIIKEV